MMVGSSLYSTPVMVLRRLMIFFMYVLKALLHRAASFSRVHLVCASLAWYHAALEALDSTPWYGLWESKQPREQFRSWQAMGHWPLVSSNRYRSTQGKGPVEALYCKSNSLCLWL